MKVKTKPKPKQIYRCPKCNLYMAEVGKQLPFIRIRVGCVCNLPPGEAPQLKCTCGHTTYIMKASR